MASRLPVLVICNVVSVYEKGYLFSVKVIRKGCFFCRQAHRGQNSISWPFKHKIHIVEPTRNVLSIIKKKKKNNGSDESTNLFLYVSSCT